MYICPDARRLGSGDIRVVTMPLYHHLYNFISQNTLLHPDRPLVIGVSGGPDSLCLLHVLVRLRETYRFQLQAAHLNHCLRGTESDSDEQYVRHVAEKWGVPLSVSRKDTSLLASQQRAGMEEAARQERYRFLGRVAGQVGARTVCVGHNADDQAETVFMHLLRGSGLNGLQGMLPAGPYPIPELELRLVRPLLRTPRSAIEAYCRQHSLQPRTDHSNLDVTLLRNRVRHKLLPALEEASPGIRRRLCQLAQVVAADMCVLEVARDDSWRDVVSRESKGVVELDLEAWRALPLGLRRSTLRQAIAQVRGSLSGISFRHIESARATAEVGKTGARAGLPGGLELAMGYDRAVLSASRAIPLSSIDAPLLGDLSTVDLALPGDTALPGSCWNVRTGILPGTPKNLTAALANDDAETVYLDADKVGSELVLRQRRTGERFQPLGMGGKSALLSDFMINRRIPAAVRDRVPILSTGAGSQGDARAGQVLWIVGWRPDERSKVTEQTQRILRVSLSRHLD